MNQGIIYKITNKVNGKAYIGLTTMPLRRRWKDHKQAAKSRDYPLCRAIRKYGEDAFLVEELWGTSNLGLMEQYFIALHNTMSPNGYNLTAGGERPKFSAETRKKISEVQIGRTPWNKGLKTGPMSQDQINKSASGHCKSVMATSIATGEVKHYVSQISAKSDGFDPSQISLCCKHPQKHLSHKGHKWSYNLPKMTEKE